MLKIDAYDEVANIFGFLKNLSTISESEITVNFSRRKSCGYQC